MITSCCEDYPKLDFSKMTVPALPVVWLDGNLWLAAILILVHPSYWMVVSKYEYRTKHLSKLCGSNRIACAMFAVTILTLGIVRDYWYSLAITSQPRWLLLQNNAVLWFGQSLVAGGAVLVITSFYSLGFFGTFLGDHFGILMTEKVSSFPFNVVNNPMYVGATLAFLGSALVNASFSGILLTGIAAVMYWIAAKQERNLLCEIYLTGGANKKSQ